MTSSWKAILRILLCTFPLLLATTILDSWWYKPRSSESQQREQLYAVEPEYQTMPITAQPEVGQDQPSLEMETSLNIGEILDQDQQFSNYSLQPTTSSPVATIDEKPNLIDLVTSSNLLAEQIKEQQVLQSIDVEKYTKQTVAYKSVVRLLEQRMSPMTVQFTQAYDHALKALQAAKAGQLQVAKFWSLVATIRVHIISAADKGGKSLTKLEEAFDYALQAATALDPKVGNFWGMAASFKTYAALRSDPEIAAKFNVASIYAINAARTADLRNLTAAEHWEQAALYQHKAIVTYEAKQKKKTKDNEQISIYLSRAATAAEKQDKIDPRQWLSGEELEEQAGIALQAAHPELVVFLAEKNNHKSKKELGQKAQFWAWAANYRYGAMVARNNSRFELVDLFTASEKRITRTIANKHRLYTQAILKKLAVRHGKVLAALQDNNLNLAKELELVVKYSMNAVEASFSNKKLASYWDKAADYQKIVATSSQAVDRELSKKMRVAVEFAKEAAVAAIKGKVTIADYWIQAADNTYQAGIAVAEKQPNLVADFSKASEFMVQAAIEGQAGRKKLANRWQWLAASVRMTAEANRDGKPALAKEFARVTDFAKLTNEALKNGENEVAHYWNWAANNQKEAAILLYSGSTVGVNEYKEATSYAEKAASSYLHGKKKLARYWAKAARLINDAAEALQAGDQQAAHLYRQQVNEVISQITSFSD